MNLQSFLKQGIYRGGISGGAGSTIIALWAMIVIASYTTLTEPAVAFTISILVGIVAIFVGVIPAVVAGSLCGGAIGFSSYYLRNHIYSPQISILHGTCWGGFLILVLWFSLLHEIDIASLIALILIVLLSGAYTGYHIYNEIRHGSPKMK